MNPDEFEDARAKHLALSTAGNDHHFIVFLIDAIRKLREPGWHAAAGKVIITMTRDDYDALLLQLGYAAGCAGRNDDPVFHRNNILLLNRLNAGNPNYTMYRVEPEGKIGK